jgi:hypothetical protein
MNRTHPARPRALSQPCAGCMVGQGRQCACRGEGAQPVRYSALAPVVNVLLILALFAAVKLKLVAAAVVLAVFTAYAAWRAWA